jgi:hypothetical protein
MNQIPAQDGTVIFYCDPKVGTDFWNPNPFEMRNWDVFTVGCRGTESVLLEQRWQPTGRPG